VIRPQTLESPVGQSEETPTPAHPEAHDPEVETGDAAVTGAPDDEQPVPGSPGVAESVITAASEVLDKVGDRLERLLLSKAQIFETQDILERLKQQLAEPDQDVASLSADLQRTEKILKKMERKEQRRYDTGKVEHFYLQEGDHSDILSFGNTAPKELALKTQERLEEILMPGLKSLQLTFQLGPAKKGNGPKQKGKLTDVLDCYCLLPYATDDSKNGRITHINIPEDSFRSWLINFRTKVTAVDEDDDGWN